MTYIKKVIQFRKGMINYNFFKIILLIYYMNCNLKYSILIIFLLLSLLIINYKENFCFWFIEDNPKNNKYTEVKCILMMQYYIIKIINIIILIF